MSQRRVLFTLYLLVSLLALVASFDRALIAQSARRPNIVLIVSDDQGYADLGCLSRDVQTPALDRLARDGVRLTDFYVTWPACTPSRGSLLTGRYPQRNGIYDMIRNEAPDYGHRYTPQEYEVTFERIGGMDTREILISGLLRDASYRCGIFGKWDLGSLHRYLPRQRGFHEFYGFVNTGIDYFTHERYGVPSMYRNDEPTVADRGTYCTDLFRREALRFIRANRSRPFFLYLPFNAPHSASNLDPKIRSAPQAPDKYKKLYPQYEEQYVARPKHRYWKNAQVPTRDTRRLLYLASLTAMDEAIGEVLDLLDELNLADNTLVLFLSDNGGSGIADNRPLRGHKGQMFEGGIRVCAMARFPGRIEKGTVSREFLTSLEIVPTLLAVAGATAPKDLELDGFDMLPILAGKERSPRRVMCWKRREREAIRWRNWKWIRNADGTYLFDLSSDPGEKNNLIESRPGIAKKLEERFRSWQQAMRSAEPRGPFRDF
ncbi:MAG TPA: N-acetylgalactosamine-6-sulfatase [Planctomycetaceae bacterium]|nr:N-acetylgalactosamine-6-sulfatase [Planctomycetaceae bacterium]